MSEVASQVFGPTSGLRVLVADLRCRSEGNCSEALFVRRLSGLVSPSREKEGEKERERERFGAETGERGRERERDTHTHTPRPLSGEHAIGLLFQGAPPIAEHWCFLVLSHWRTSVGLSGGVLFVDSLCTTSHQRKNTESPDDHLNMITLQWSFALWSRWAASLRDLQALVTGPRSHSFVSSQSHSFISSMTG